MCYLAFISYKITLNSQEEEGGGAPGGLLNLGHFALNRAEFPGSRWWRCLLPVAGLSITAGSLLSLLFPLVILDGFCRFC